MRLLTGAVYVFCLCNYTVLVIGWFSFLSYLDLQPNIHLIHNWPLTWDERAAKHEIESFWDKISRSLNETSETMSVVLSESDIPGSSLNGRNPSELKNDELRFWLKCHDDPAKGLRTKAEFLSGKLVLFDRCIHF